MALLTLINTNNFSSVKKAEKGLKLSSKEVTSNRKNLTKVGNADKESFSSDKSSDDEPKIISRQKMLS